MKKQVKIGFCGGIAGIANGLFGAGGGMLLVPLLGMVGGLDSRQVFPASVSIIFPICIVSLIVRGLQSGLPVWDALPYMLGSVIGGLAAGKYGQRIPVLWLHRILGALILWGGVRYLCS